MISCDDSYLPFDQCPKFDLASLPWVRGIPTAFLKRGNVDFNHPDSVRCVARGAKVVVLLVVPPGLFSFSIRNAKQLDWNKVFQQLDHAVANATGIVIVEGAQISTFQSYIKTPILQRLRIFFQDFSCLATIPGQPTYAIAVTLLWS